MNPTIYKQLDSRWSSKPYPTKASSFGGNGCGCCACTHIAMEQTDKANWTPENLRQWMINQGFAYAGKGTTWQGITATLEYIGHGNVVRIWSDPMSVAFAELEKGNRIGVFLFSAGYGGTDKIYWTAGGHYVAFTDSKYENGDWWFYCKDSGGRNHDGWFSYTKHMRGVVAKVWLVERLEKVEPKPYSGEFPNITTTKQVSILDDALAWGKKIADDNSYIYKKWNSKDANTKKCSWCNPELLKTPKYKGANCIGFGGAMLHHGGGASVPCKCNGLVGGNETYSKCTLAYWKKRNGANWVELSKAQRGCTIVCFDKNGKYKHIATQWSSGYVIDATSSKGIAVRKSALSQYKKKYFLYTGTKTVTTTTVLKKGDKGAEVTKLQKYLNWYKNYGLSTDGIWGNATQKAVVDMQTDFFGAKEADGLVGTKTIEKMKAVKK